MQHNFERPGPHTAVTIRAISGKVAAFVFGAGPMGMAEMKLCHIVHETAQHYVLRVAKGFEVYRNGVCAAERCAQIGYEGQKGLDRAIAEIRRRENNLLIS